MSGLPYFHQTILQKEVKQLIPERSPLVFLDLTLGGGGHTAYVLQHCPQVEKVVACDRDPDALVAAKKRLHPYLERIHFSRNQFSQIGQIWKEKGWRNQDVVLADLGVSSPQLDQAERGFSFRQAGPLDMRMSQTGMSLAEYLESVSEEELARQIATDGEERFARKIASVIRKNQAALSNTVELANLVRDCIPRSTWKKGHDPATRTFQALRIAVNQEKEELASLLQELPNLLADKGVGIFISFHSIEDRMIKTSFREGMQPCSCPPRLVECVCNKKPIYKILTHSPVLASDEEIQQNPRARSAKLRAVQRLERGGSK